MIDPQKLEALVRLGMQDMEDKWSPEFRDLIKECDEATQEEFAQRLAWHTYRLIMDME
jgi:hypothetical protein